MEKNVRAGARKKKWNVTRDYLAIVRNQSQGHRDLGSCQERTSSLKDQVGAERSNLLLDCSDGESLPTNSSSTCTRCALMGSASEPSPPPYTIAPIITILPPTAAMEAQVSPLTKVPPLGDGRARIQIRIPTPKLHCGALCLVNTAEPSVW